MQIVIDIDDKLYNRIKYLEPRADTMLDELMRSVQNGTPLPKGHGRIGDLDILEKEIDGGIKAGLMIEGYENYSNINDMDDCLECIKYALTIIEADTESEDKE